MSPQATLRIALDALCSLDPDEARDALADYTAWRQAGGFEPRIGRFRGDVVAGSIAHAIGMLAPAEMED
jgi:hypothetical protein